MRAEYHFNKLQSYVFHQESYDCSTLSFLIDNAIIEDELACLKLIGHAFQAAAFRKKLTTAILSSKEHFSKVLMDSYFHGNGFAKIVLLTGENFKLRFHHFLKEDSARAEENIHDHRWNFCSAVLDGHINTPLFEIDPTQKDHFQYIYYSNKSNGEYRHSYVDDCGVLKLTDWIVSKGEVYFMPSHSMHRICDVSKDGALTAIITGKSKRSTCNLVSRTLREGEAVLIQNLGSQLLLTELNLFIHGKLHRH